MEDIPQDELEIECWPPRRRGGQHVGSGPNGIKITHLPSGLTAISENQRSQHRNRAVAMDMILGGLTSPGFHSR